MNRRCRYIALWPIGLVLMVLVRPVAVVAATQASYYVSDGTAGTIVRLEDVNGDGDALDAGEKHVWAEGFTRIVELEHDQGSLFAVEEGLTDGLNQIIRLTDINGDGDALDVGERTVWADGFDEPRGIAHDGQGGWFVTEIEDDLVWRLADLNSDGDALDANERSLYADGINGATTVMPHGGDLLVTAFFGDQVHRLIDHNQDGDALDTGENIVVAVGIDQPLGLLGNGQGGFFFGSRTADTVFQARDLNHDGDMLDITEVLSYADAVFGGVNAPWGMTARDEGGFLLADYADGQILWVRDVNGDGDALDLGEVSLFADGLTLPVDIVAILEPVGLPGDANGDGLVDVADLGILGANWGLPDRTHEQGDFTCDGVVDVADLGILGANWTANQTLAAHLAGAPNFLSTPIPEPTTAALMMVIFMTTARPRCHRHRARRQRLG